MPKILPFPPENPNLALPDCRMWALSLHARYNVLMSQIKNIGLKYDTIVY